MKRLSNRIIDKVNDRISKYNNWVFDNWVIHSILKGAFFSIIFPLVYLASIISTYSVELYWLPWLPIAFFFLMFPSFILLDRKRISVIENRPVDYLKAERVERFFEIAFWILFPLWLMSIVTATYSERVDVLRENISFLSSFSIVLVLAWGGLLYYIEINIVEKSSLLRKIKERLIVKNKWRFWEFYPSETARARARFVVVLNSLSSDPDCKKISKKFDLFFQGVKIYTGYMREEFGFFLHNPQRFYRQAMLAACSKDNVDSIKKGLQSLVELMRNEKREPLEIVKSLKELLNESATFKDVCEEIDADPEPMKRWFFVHSDSVIGIVGLILAVVAIMLPPIFNM